jgi:hypothetical protein
MDDLSYPDARYHDYLGNALDEETRRKVVIFFFITETSAFGDNRAELVSIRGVQAPRVNPAGTIPVLSQPKPREGRLTKP